MKIPGLDELMSDLNERSDRMQEGIDKIASLLEELVDLTRRNVPE